jgi:CRISPR-associated protein Cas2
MLVIVIENAPLRLHGYLSRLFLEVRAGVFVGNYSARVRERTWVVVEKGIEEGNGVMAWTAPNDAGFDFVTCGPSRRVPVVLDGLKLCSFRPMAEPGVPLRTPAHAPNEPQKVGRFFDKDIKA